MNPLDDVLVIGAGVMGIGIAQVAAEAGHRVFRRMNVSVSGRHYDQINQQYLSQMLGVATCRNESGVSRPDFKRRVGATLEQRDRLRTVFCGHPQLLHQLFDMRDFVLRDVPIRLGQFAHRDEHRFEEYALTICILQRVYSAGTIGSRAVDQ